MSTLHSSKGLEYDTVFLVDVNENVMPNKKAVLDADLEEERLDVLCRNDTGEEPIISALVPSDPKQRYGSVTLPD